MQKLRIQKTKSKQRRSRVRRCLIGTTAVLFLGLGFAYYLNYRVSYSYAKSHADVGIRQRYLNLLVQQHGLAEGLKKVEYSHEYLKGYYFPEEPAAMITRFSVSPLEISDIRISVYPPAFTRADSEDEFLSMLKDHEYRHVDQGMRKVQIRFSPAEYESVKPELGSRLFDIDGDLYLIFSELDAFEWQINAFPQRKVSESFQRKMFRYYTRLQDSLDVKPKTPLVMFLKRRFPWKLPGDRLLLQ